ncbi:hypothetical protein [Hymenobacter baengnokdamensis]|uniref:hypothetical protein n=1 Tax=Hymenobacter baengnokdamensis TaxID=2615203 RepID=UPI00124939A1|nr:hypothetical protein [Hymenobacter baengnokdamensis]
MSQQLKPGDRALVVGKHPNAGHFVTLVSFGPYGLDFLKLVGWHVCEDETGLEYYAKEPELARLDRDDQAPAPDDQVLVVQAEDLPESELAPTVSPGRRETTLDRLRAYFKAVGTQAPVVLTTHQQQVLTRLDAAWGLLLAAKTNEKATSKLISRFQVSRAQAYRDLADCKQLYGDVVKSSKEADRYLLKEMALDTYNRAKKAGEIKEMNSAVATLVKITGLDKADAHIPDPESLEPSNYLLEVKGQAGPGLTLNLEAIAGLPAHEYEAVMDAIQHHGNSPLEMLQRIQEAARGITE